MRLREIRAHRGVVWGMVAGLISAAGTVTAASLPEGFSDVRVTSNLTNVTTMAVAPDGRVFVSEQAGRLRVIENDVLLPTPAITLTVDATNERGLLGIAFDPAFAANQHVYLYYTLPPAAPGPFPTLGAHNRVSRFTLSGNVVVPGSELILLELPDLGTAPIHNAGSLHFGADGKLYVSVGENFNAAQAQLKNNPLGKLLRINPDGTIPPDNPFVGEAGAYAAIWAFGLRNPFTFAIQPTTGRIFVNDVGDKLYDEINDIVKGGNYGWPETEGPHNDPRFIQPFFYTPWDPQNCTTIGAAFYNPAVRDFPVTFEGKYFFGDLCGNYIKVMDPATGTAELFATGLNAGLLPGQTSQLVDLDVSPDGKVYFLNRGNQAGSSSVWRIFHGHGAPTISAHPANVFVSDGEVATFSCTGSGSAPLTYRWLRGGAYIPGAESPVYSFTVNMGDNGAVFRCEVSNEFGSVPSNPATLTVTSNRTPTATILTPTVGSTYQAGQTLFFSGDAFDAEDGTLDASRFSWSIAFHHADHVHPGIDVAGVKGGSYAIPNQTETDTNVFYRVNLTVTDSTGLVRHVFTDVRPEISTLTVNSSPQGRTIKLDGKPRTTPFTVPSVVGMIRSLSVDPTFQQEVENSPVWYEFTSWNNGGPATQQIVTPPAPATLSASFTRVVNPECITFPILNRFINLPFPVQTGQFSIEFDATPTTGAANATIGFSDGPRGGLPGQAGAIIFNNTGRIQGRGFTGGEPANPNGPAYVAGQTYHFRLEIDIDTHTYNAYYTPPGGTEVLFAPNLRFRVEHQFITKLDNWGVFAGNNPSNGTVRVCRFSVNCSNAKNTPPVISVPANVIVKTGTGATACSRVVSDAELGTATVTDNCRFGLSGVTRSGVPAGNLFPVGTTTITYTATDGTGLTTTATQTVTVVDDTKPALGTVTAVPNVLWPPDHRMVTVNINYTASDNCNGLQTVLSVKSDQPLGIYRPDWIIVDNHTVKLRAERSILPALFGKGRTYTITVDAIDASGNVTTRTVLVKVPAWLHSCHTGSRCRNTEHRWDKVGD